MKITYQKLKLILPLEGVIHIESFFFQAAFNEHARVSVRLLMEEEGIQEAIHGLSDGAKIEVYENGILFIGKVTNVKMVPARGLYYLDLNAVSYTYEWGLELISQSFLNLDATYEQVMRKVLENQRKADIMDYATEGAAIPDFLLQYEESDWSFLIRIASQFQTFLVADYTVDYGRAYFGIPPYQEEVNLREEEYQTIKDMERYDRINLSGELLSQEIMKWEVKTGHSFILAQNVRFREISTMVTKIRYQTIDGELCRFYELSRKKGVLSVPLKNQHISGMSIPATVKERSGNCIRAHFHIDQEYDSSPNVKFFTYAIESSFIYCMPEVESQVHIYFPSADEKDAIAVHAIRTESSGGASSGSSGGGYAQNPAYKSFSNVNGAELLLTPDFANVAAEEAKSTCIHLDTSGNAYIKGNEVELKSEKNFMIGEPMSEGGEATAAVRLEATSISVVVSDTEISLTEEAKIVAAFVKIDSSDVTPTEKPSAQEVFDFATAGNEDMLKNINDGAAAQLVEKYEQGRDKVFGAIAKIATTVVTVAVVVAVTVASAGTLTGPLMIATYALTATTLTYCAADMMEGTQDIKKSMSGDLSESHNFVRDTVFSVFGENKEFAYNIAKMINDIAFGVVTGKAMGSAFKAMADAGKIFKFACNSQQLKYFKTAIQVGNNVFSGIINNLAYTGKINVGDMALNLGIGMVQGMAGSGITNWAMERLGMKGVNTITAKALMTVIGTGVDTGLEGFISLISGKEFNAWESLARNAYANALSAFIADPVDAVTGAYIIDTTDFILASIPAAFKLGRIYRSTDQKSSVIGKGWSFPYASQIFYDTGNENRLHMDTITGHAVCFEKMESQWVNQSRGASRFILEEDRSRNRYVLSDVAEHTLCIYNEAGYLMQVEYPNRQRMQLEYESGGLSRIITPLGNILEIVNRKGKILQITDEIGRKIQYRYEEDYLTDVVHADEGITHYEYDVHGIICSVTDQNGHRYLENEYDERGRILRQKFENGVCQNFMYDDRNRRNTITFSENGKREIYEYNKELLTERIIYEDGTCISKEYSEQNLKTGETSRTGARSEWKYDSFGRLISEMKPGGFEICYEYDKNHDLVRVWDTDQRETQYQYDEEHNQRMVREKISAQQWKKTVIDHDGKGRCISEQDGVGNITLRQYSPNRAYPSRVITPKGEETVYAYDQVGRRMSIGNAYGTVQLSYNSRNFVTSRTDGEGNSSYWMYDQMGRLKSYYPARHWKNQKAGYEYRYNFMDRLVDTITPLKEHKRLFRNFDGDITKIIHPASYQEKKENGDGIQYEYDWDGNCIRIAYPDGGVERRFYDADGNLLKQVQPEYYDDKKDDGSGYTYAYDERRRLIKVQDLDGRMLRCYEYNGHDQIVRELNGEGKEILTAYNGLGQKISERISIRREENITYYRFIAYQYDNQGNKVEEAYGNEEVSENRMPASWHRVCFSYDGNNRLVCVKDEFGAKIRYDYDCLGNLILKEQTVEDGINHRIRYYYNKSGWRIRKEEDLQGNGAIRSAVTRYKHDENGNVTRVLTPKGFELHRSYDENDRLTGERILDKKNGIDRKVSYTYDAAGNLLGEILHETDGNTLYTSYQYDLRDRLTRRMTQSGAATRYLYDKNSRLLKEISPYGYEEETDSGAGTTYSYDIRGNRCKVINGLNQMVEERAYNTQNKLVQQTDGLGYQTEFSWTLDEQIKEIRQVREDEKRTLQTYKYNARNQIIGVVDGINETVSYDLDSWGRITGVGYSDGVKDGYEYTPSGQVSKAIDGNGNVAEYRFNSLGRVRERIDQAGDIETFEYDEEGNLLLHRDRDGNQITRFYNVFGNPVYEKAVDHKGKNACITTYRYDSLGRLVRGISDGHSYEYVYNKQGLLKEKCSSGKRLISYEYDKSGQITQITDPVGVITCYEYDILGRMRRLYTDRGMEIQYKYDCLNRLVQIFYGNGVTTCYLYDQNGNVSRLETMDGEKKLLSFTYEYDGNGNRTAKTGDQIQADGSSSILNTTYQYDVRGQLLKETQNDDIFCYTYDAAGNRLKKESSEGEICYKYNEKNQLICEEGINGQKFFTYTKQGSIIEEDAPSGSRHYHYNTKNQQVKVEMEDGRVQVNRYDAEGLRYEMKENEKLLRFIYHRGELLYENKSGKEEQTSYHLGYGTEAIRQEEQTYYYHRDEQLSTALITNEIGELKNHYHYDVFGIILQVTEGISNRIRYTGQQYDGLTGQYYLRARFYNSRLGRFMQEDVYHADGLNLYRYCHNNPVTYYDPSGYDTDNPWHNWRTENKDKYPKDEMIAAYWEFRSANSVGDVYIPPYSKTNQQFQEWFDSQSIETMNAYYGDQAIKDQIGDYLRGPKGLHEWHMVSFANVFKEWGLTANDIMNMTSPTNFEFINIVHPKTGELISGSHTGSSAGSYAHIELAELIKKSNNEVEFVSNLRDWADKHIEGGADALPGFLKRGEELPEHLKSEEEVKPSNC